VKIARYQYTTLQTILFIYFSKSKCLAPSYWQKKGRYSLFERRTCICSLSSH
jgi:hypothetical protein